MAKKQTITDREIWDLKYTLAEYSVERLKIFKDYIIKGHNKTMPSSILGVDDEEKTKNWIEILEKII
ncbi:MAG: hypothetical protein NXI00_24105, partial [Cytophagales bacterium]|nr:hypothetical protein [Cytophagales bacterium]